MVGKEGHRHFVLLATEISEGKESETGSVAASGSAINQSDLDAVEGSVPYRRLPDVSPAIVLVSYLANPSSFNPFIIDQTIPAGFSVLRFTSYPRPMGQRPLGNATAMGLRGVKFPNPSKVSSPAGEWAKEGRNSTGRVNVANKDGIFFPEDIVDQPIVPSSGSGRIKTSFVPSPTCADGNTFCESVDDYPDGHINSILQNNAVQFKTLFGEDTIDPPLSHRIDAVDENPMCASQVSSICAQKQDRAPGSPKLGT
ncbi:hypothetical protein AAG570_003350 [Ranatra chinensis]|uniref:Uncharacterized protein n=1 Tax=Ranatra chinensis TaxID=642074 RepID=A0ABD0YHU6_9HEMI